MVRAEIYMTDGNEERAAKIETCDFILTLGLQYREDGMELHAGVFGKPQKGIVEALACGMVKNLKDMGKGRAGKVVALLKFQKAFGEAAKEEVWKMISEAGEDDTPEAATSRASSNK